MYINTELLDKKGIEWRNNDLIVLQVINQKSNEVLDERCKDALNRVYKLGYLKFIKGTKGQTNYEKVRINPQGKEFLRQLEIPDITEASKHLTKRLIEIYENHNKEYGNEKKISTLVAWFLAETGIPAKEVFKQVENYLLETPPKYIMKLENLIHKKDHVYQTKWKMENSKLYELCKK